MDEFNQKIQILNVVTSICSSENLASNNADLQDFRDYVSQRNSSLASYIDTILDDAVSYAKTVKKEIKDRNTICTMSVNWFKDPNNTSTKGRTSNMGIFLQGLTSYRGN